MPKIEQNSGYQNKHPKIICLNNYNGVASNLMELDDAVADRFMQVSDMRSDVVIMRKPQDRVRDYDEIGFVKVAKLLKLPRLDLWRNTDALLQTKKEKDTWYIAINDQELADQVARTKSDKRKFDERFIDQFRTEVKIGLTTCLIREKLLNGGQYNFGFLIGYQGLISYNLFLGPALATASLINRDPALFAETIAFVATVNAGWNACNIFGTCLTYMGDHIERKLGTSSIIKLLTPHFNDPFIKHSIPELIMPPVPLDRLIRGLYYLNKHGLDLIIGKNKLVYPSK